MADINAQKTIAQEQLTKVEDLEEEIAQLTPGSSKLKSLNTRLKKANNALAQMTAKLNRLIQQYEQGS
jgi:uncharacterized phage infection (PIP) family protein YhgE